MRDRRAEARQRISVLRAPLPDRLARHPDACGHVLPAGNNIAESDVGQLVTVRVI